MKVEKIITIANAATRLEFIGMERSLRASGSTLPICVIPYNEDLFDLPSGSTWWRIPELEEAVKSGHPCFRKYQCFLTENYQFVDTDCVFLQNPESALAPYSGFVVCCGHWRDATHAVTHETKERLSQRSTNWQQNLFNSGQFACDVPLFDLNSLVDRIQSDSVLLSSQHHEQPACNLLVYESGVAFTNLTLPPHRIESSWAGDYPAEYDPYWRISSRKPYLIHWAGLGIRGDRPIDKLFLRHLSEEERAALLPQKSGWFARWHR